MRLMRALQKLVADILIFDIAAGTHQRATDFFDLADLGVIIIEPVPTSLENAFSFLKNLLTRALLRYFYHDKEMAALVIDSLDPKKTGKVLSFNELLDICEKKSPAKIISFREQVLHGFRKTYLVANSIHTSGQEKVAEEFHNVLHRFLSLETTVAGDLPYEHQMDSALAQRVPFVSGYPDSGFTGAMKRIAGMLIAP
jgi:flagellar biosynthesis protein FlhG